MTTTEIYRRLKSGEKLTVKVTQIGARCWDEGPDAGMVADLLDFGPCDVIEDEDTFSVTLDFSPYLEYNQKIASDKWTVPGTDHTGATWFSSGCYPANGVLTGYISTSFNDKDDNDCLEVLENASLYRSTVTVQTDAMRDILVAAIKWMHQENDVEGKHKLNALEKELPEELSCQIKNVWCGLTIDGPAPDTKKMFHEFWTAIAKAAQWDEDSSSRYSSRFSFSFWMFPQIWGSTALGFDSPGTIGCSAMTTAPTTVIWCKELNIAGVFFGGRGAYTVESPNDAFWEDIKHQQIASLTEAKEKYRH